MTAAREQCRSQHLEPPSPERLERLVRSVLRRHEDTFCATLLASLTPETIAGLDALLHPPDPGEVGGGNPVRLHSGLGYRSPMAYEANMETTLTRT